MLKEWMRLDVYFGSRISLVENFQVGQIEEPMITAHRVHHLKEVVYSYEKNDTFVGSG